MARARRPHRDLTAPLRPEHRGGPGGRKNLQRSGREEARLPGRGNFSDPPGCGRGPRDPALSRASRNGHAQRRPEKEAMAGHISGPAAQDRQPPVRALGLDHARSQELPDMCCKTPFTGTDTHGRDLRAIEPESGDLPKWAKDQTGIADGGGLSALFVPAQLIRAMTARRGGR